MKTARIISIVSLVIYTFFFFGLLQVFFKIGELYSELNIAQPALGRVLPLIIGGAVLLVNAGWLIFLLVKERKGQEVKSALLVSSLILVLPASYLGFSIISFILPLYNLTSSF
jgi:hypothetical protein